MRHRVILAGGSGTRLWPASRSTLPKQFLQLFGDESLLQATVRRGRDTADGPTWVVTASSQAAMVRAQCPTVRVIEEPVGRNTAIAVGLAAAIIHGEDCDAVLGVLPADQHVGHEGALTDVFARAFAAAARADVICTVGIVPTRAETGFGYLQTGEASDPTDPIVRRVERFVEKPDTRTAADYVASGKYLWNAGMFFARARVLLAEISRHLPDLAAGLDAVRDAVAKRDDDARHAAIRDLYANARSVSLDHGVMEKASGIVTIPADVGWSDVGSWQAVAEATTADPHGNAAVTGNAIVVDGNDNVIATDAGVVAICGVSDLVVVRAGDAVLVIPRERCQDVRALTEELGRRGLEKFR